MEDKEAILKAHSVEYHSRGWQWTIYHGFIDDNKPRILREIDEAIRDLNNLKEYIASTR